MMMLQLKIILKKALSLLISNLKKLDPEIYSGFFYLKEKTNILFMSAIKKCPEPESNQ